MKKLMIVFALFLFGCESEQEKAQRLEKKKKEKIKNDSLLEVRKKEEAKKFDSLQAIRRVEIEKKAIELAYKESKIRKAVIEKGNIYLSVNDDGTNRDGFAEYFCQVLKDEKCTGMNVFIVDIKDDNKTLGSSNCKF